MNQKEKNAARENIYDTIKDIFDIEGRTTEGLLIKLVGGGYASIKVIVKNEGFNAEDKIEEYEELAAKRAEKAEKSKPKDKKA